MKQDNESFRRAGNRSFARRETLFLRSKGDIPSSVEVWFYPSHRGGVFVLFNQGKTVMELGRKVGEREARLVRQNFIDWRSGKNEKRIKEMLLDMDGERKGYGEPTDKDEEEFERMAKYAVENQVPKFRGLEGSPHMVVPSNYEKERR